MLNPLDCLEKLKLGKRNISQGSLFKEITKLQKQQKGILKQFKEIKNMLTL